MLYTDPVYGSFDITDPVILELLNASVLQRLKHINQSGYTEPFFHGNKRNRFDHSMGVYCLLHKYQAPLEEQIAGLIHDVSHATFSHAIDYVLAADKASEESFQDNIFEHFVLQSAIPTILKKYEVSMDYILDENNFPLQETKLPDICADRIDYFLRDSLSMGYINSDFVQNVLADLVVENNKWVFKTYKTAQMFAEGFRKTNAEHYAGLVSAVMLATIADYLRHALDQGYVTKTDFFTTDSEVLSKINVHLGSDSKLQKLFDRMNNKVPFSNNPQDYEKHITCKSRIVDPLCYHENKLQRVSDINHAWKDVLINDSKPKEYFIKFEA